MKNDCIFKVPRMGIWDSLFGKALNFYGRGTVTLQETGLLVHGDLPMFIIPFVGRFYSRILAEPTMRTVPYSQIVLHRRTGRWFSFGLLKVVFLLLWFVATGALFVLGATGMPFVMAISLGIAAFLVIPVVILMFNRGTHYITYRLPCGKRSQFAMRIRPLSEQVMTDFSRRLEELQAAAAAFDDPQTDGAN